MKISIILLLLGSILLTACSPIAITQETNSQEAITPTSEPFVENEPEEEQISSDNMQIDEVMPAPPVELPNWMTTPLTDVRTGAAFSVSDYKGKIILVEMLATWCSTCKRQQQEIVKLKETTGDDVVTVGIGVDTNETPEILKSYIEANEFGWQYAVADVDFIREIANLYTANYVNPPAAPILLVDKDGIPRTLPFGVKTADDLLKYINEYDL